MDVDEQMQHLVAADPLHSTPPDLARLRQRGHRRLVQARIVAGAAAIGVAAAVIVPIAVIRAGNGDDAPPRPATSQSTAATPTPTSTPSFYTEGPRGSLRVDGLNHVGTWENQPVAGDVLVIGQLGPYEEVLYATRETYREEAQYGEQTPIILGIRDGDRILRVTQVLSPDVEEPDGIGLYDGIREEPTSGSPTYTLFGVAPAGSEVSVRADDGGPTRPVTASSSTVLPGSVVFVDTGAWQSGWDPVQFAPLTIVTSEGDEVSVRERSISQ